MDEKLSLALNDQMNFEIYSSYIYLSMSSYFKSISMNGMCNWMDIQAREEATHARRFYNYLHERGEKVVLDSIPKPGNEWDSPLAVFKDALAHEKEVTARVNKLIDLSMEVRDHATTGHLQWFIDEQVEEEANAMEIVRQLEIAKDSPHALMLLDRELGQRVFVDPTTEA